MKLIKKKNSDVSTLTSKYLGTNNNNNNNNNCIYIALFPVGSVQSALQYIIPQRPLHSRDMYGSHLLPTLARRTIQCILKDSIGHHILHGGLHIARYRLLLGRQVTLGGKTGITTLDPGGFEPTSPRTAAERLNHSTTDATGVSKIFSRDHPSIPVTTRVLHGMATVFWGDQPLTNKVMGR